MHPGVAPQAEEQAQHADQEARQQDLVPGEAEEVRPGSGREGGGSPHRRDGARRAACAAPGRKGRKAGPGANSPEQQQQQREARTSGGHASRGISWVLGWRLSRRRSGRWLGIGRGVHHREKALGQLVGLALADLVGLDRHQGVVPAFGLHGHADLPDGAGELCAGGAPPRTGSAARRRTRRERRASRVGQRDGCGGSTSCPRSQSSW